MRRKELWVVGLLAMLLGAGACFGQDSSSTVSGKHFMFVFVVKEVDGPKVLNTRTYTAIVSEGQRQTQIRAGSTVKVFDNPSHTSSHMAEIGFDLDCQSIAFLVEHNDVAMALHAGYTSVIGDASSTDDPIVRRNSWQSQVVVPVGKATTLFTSDDMTGKHQIQLELTAKQIP